MLPTIAREPDAVVMIDQRKLPAEEVYVRCKSAGEVARAIKTMVIRGAPAIGVAAAMGIAIGMRRSKATGTQKFDAEAQAIHDEDVANCRALGAFGADLVPADARVLTHCNAGALATEGYGT